MTIHPTFSQPFTPTQPYDPAFDNPLKGKAGPLIPQAFVQPTSLWARMSNEDRLARVRELNAQDLSPAEIAVELEATTSAVRSVAFRAGLRLSGTIAVPRKGPPMVRVDDVSEETWQPIGGTPLRLERLSEHTCKWPVGAASGSAQEFCGCHVENRVKGRKRAAYCETHAKISRGE